MKNSYTLPNGTLKNLLGITDSDELEQAETDIGFTKLMNIQEELGRACDANLLRRINKHILGDVFEWAGEYRRYPVRKKEDLLDGESIIYTMPEDIQDELYITTKDMNEYDWKNKSLDEITEKFASFLAKLWRIHPFREGNTRTVLGFAEIFAKEHGFEMDMGNVIDNLDRIEDPDTGEIKRYSIRDRFLLASLDKEDDPEPEHLEWILKKSIESGIEKRIDELDELLDR